MASIQNTLTVLSVATSATLPATAVAYKALSWSAVGGVSNIGDFGDTYNKIEAKVLGTRRVQKFKGSVDAGPFEVTCVRDTVDAGQIALRTAAKSDVPVFLKLELGDKPATGASPTGTLFYLPVSVYAAPVKTGEQDSMVEQTFTCEIVGDIIEVAPSAT
ncbi:hypothetical protein [Methylopila sp. 73B]|uniref:hypothetical protein n=1 Tax=Methylopila sp. 73B TaxID=1120792 RepID=UPI0003693747|nr:hypothetical protein [Methylopila sp. 73B]